jgi:hypothetical protein
MERPRDQFNHRIQASSHDSPTAEPAGSPRVAAPPDWPRFIADPGAAPRAADRATHSPRPTVTPRIADRPEVLPLNLPPAAAPMRAERKARRSDRPSHSRPLLLKWLRRAPLVILTLLGLACAIMSWLAVQEILNPGAEIHYIALAEKEQEQIASLFLLGGVAVGCVSVSIVLAQQLRRTPRR